MLRRTERSSVKCAEATGCHILSRTGAAVRAEKGFCHQHCRVPSSYQPFAMFATLAFDLVSDYATPYDTARGVYLTAAQTLKEATGPYKAARDAYVAATATYTKSLYE